MSQSTIMDSPKVENIIEKGDKLTFTLSGVDVSIANAIRRTILSAIPLYVFKTSPHEENKSNIIVNTSRLNNEIVKQRLSCIPICMTQSANIPLEEFILEVEKENDTDMMMYVTTKDFKLKHKDSGRYLNDNELTKIFPPYVTTKGTEYYIDFLRLRPRISDELPGEKIKLTCEISISTAREDAAFNLTAACSYGFTPDLLKIESVISQMTEKLKQSNATKDQIEFQINNYKALEAYRNVVKDSFDFIVETIGVYDNNQLMVKACSVIIREFEKLTSMCEKDELRIEVPATTISNCYDVILENEDYTIGNILNYIIYTIYYLNSKQLNYCGYKKMHPHDPDSVLRLGFSGEQRSRADVVNIIIHACSIADNRLRYIRENFVVKSGIRQTQ